MKNTDLKGVYSALLCSFTEDGAIDEKGLRAIVRHNIDVMKIDGLYVNGSTGESFMMTTEQKKEVFRIVKDEAKDAIRLIGQVGSINVYESVELAAYATSLGYDAISAVTPFYYKFSFAEIKNYYNTIMKNVDNRLIVYSIPALTGVNINVAQFKELFENKKVVGVKFTAADFFLLERLRKECPDHLIFSGFDEMMLPAAVLNVDGAIGSTFNVNGPRARQILSLAQEGKVAEALKIQNVTNDFISDVLDNGLYPTLKEILKLQGVQADLYCHLPMLSADAKQKEQAKRIYERYLKA